MPAAAACPALFDRSTDTILEKPQSLCEYAGKVVLGFPSNDFGGQEPGSNKEIASFCANQYAVEFPMFAKTVVRGAQANPLYADLARAGGGEPRWNFHKYLVDRSGRQVMSFDTKVAPNDARLVGAIDKLLAAP